MPWINQSPRALCQTSRNTPWTGHTVTHYNKGQHWATNVPEVSFITLKINFFFQSNHKAGKQKQECFLVSVLQITLWLNEINSQFSKNQLFQLSLLFNFSDVIMKYLIYKFLIT